MYKQKNTKYEIDTLDFIANSEEIANIPNDLLSEGKNIIISHPQIADNKCIMVTPERKAFLLDPNEIRNVKKRELTQEEYKLLDIKEYD